MTNREKRQGAALVLLLIMAGLADSPNVLLWILVATIALVVSWWLTM